MMQGKLHAFALMALDFLAALRAAEFSNHWISNVQLREFAHNGPPVPSS
jgi:hypothetical protein